MATERMMGRITGVGLGAMLFVSACTGSDSATPENGVVGTDVLESTTTETVELLPYDEPITVPEPDADDDGDPDGFPDEPDDDAPTTTVAPGTTLATIVPPGEDGETTTTAAGATTTAAATETTETPVNGDTEQPLQEQDSALACATVELGYLALLGGNDGSERLRDGATMAISTGLNDYVSAGQGLVDALDAGSDVDGAADALLAQCEDDGFERLA